MRAACPALLAAALLAVGPRTARGESSPQIALRLSYIRGPGAQRCPSEQTFRDAVAAKMGYDPFMPDAPERVAITLTRSTRGSTATVEFNDAGRVHGWDDKILSIRDDNCVALVKGAAFYLTLQFLPFPSLPSTTAPPAPAPPTEDRPPEPSPRAAPTPPPTPPAAPSSPPSPRSWLGEVGISPFVSFGIAPSPAFGGALYVGVHWPSVPFSVAGEFHYDRSGSGTVEGPSQAQVKTRQSGTAIVPCWRPLVFFLCGVATYSQWYAARTDVSPLQEAHNASFRTGVRVGVGGAILSHLGLRLYGDLLGTLKPATADISGGEMWSTSIMSGDVGVTFYGFL